MARKWWTLSRGGGRHVHALLLDVTIVNVALPQIQKAFGAPLPDLQGVIDAYALTLAALLLTAGAIAAITSLTLIRGRDFAARARRPRQRHRRRQQPADRRLRP